MFKIKILLSITALILSANFHVHGKSIILGLKEDLEALEKRVNASTLKASTDITPFGTFDLSGPWRYLEPQSLDDNGIHFLLYTRNHSTDAVSLIPSEILTGFNDRFNRTFDPTKPLIFLCHGFGGDGYMEWLNEMKDSFLEVQDSNVIIIDWEKGAAVWWVLKPFLSYVRWSIDDVIIYISHYATAAGNTRLVGRVTAYLVKTIAEMHGPDFNIDQVYFVGFSLGGQVAGFFANDVITLTGEKVGRVTSLEPASPLFEEKGIYNLSADCAHYIDVIHTSAGEEIISFPSHLGMTKAVGHIDYYVNGGRDQPDCYSVACYHERARIYFQRSISQCSYPGCPCQGLGDRYADGQCVDACDDNLTDFMGYVSVDRPEMRGTYFVSTLGMDSLCGGCENLKPYVTVLLISFLFTVRNVFF